MSETNYESQYAVPSTFLTGVADQARRLTDSTEALTTDEMLAALEGVTAGEPVVDAKSVTFYPEQIDPDVAHKIGYNWFAQVVELIQPMVSTIKGMTPAQIIENLNKVRYTPLDPVATAETSIDPDEFASASVGIAPVVSRNAASDVIPADVFASSASAVA